VSLWSRNVGNTNYILTRSMQVVTAEYLGEPRTFGVTVRARF
jgi:iron complex outermembrane recepter protein